MKKIVKSIILPLLLSFGASASQLPLLQQDTIVIVKGQEDSTTRIPKSAKGTIIRIELTGSYGGSGFLWENLSQTCSVLSLTGSTSEADPKLLGAPEKLIYFYRVNGKKGCAQLKFVLRRSWEKDKEPAQTFTHTVEIYKN